MRKRRSSDGPDLSEDTLPGVGDARSVLGQGCRPVRVVKVNSVVWLCLGLAVGIICGGPWLRDFMDLLRGYRWNYLDRCIMETPEDTGYGVDFCRTPVNCEMCRDVDRIEEVDVDSLSVEQFEERYAYSSRPLVVRNASIHWPAMKVLDYHWLKNIYLSDQEILEKEGDDCWFNRYKTREFRNLRSVFRLSDSRVALESGQSWYVGWAVCHDVVAQELQKLYHRPTFIHPESTPPKKPWIFIGTPGPGAHFHVDNVDLPSWQAQLSGVKTWDLKPPPECYWTCPGSLQTTLYPGDIIVVNTNMWFHSTRVTGSDLSIVITNEYD